MRIEIARITSEARRRCDGLNRILRQNVSVQQLKSLRTKHAIEAFVDSLVIESNDMYRQLKQAGINAPVAIPAHLTSLANDLHWWSQHGSFQFLVQDVRDRWGIDNDQFETYFVTSRLREYLPEHRRSEFEFIKAVCDYYGLYKASTGQLTGKQNSFWSARVEPGPDTTLARPTFRPRADYFLT